jgi:hypothetical protein
MGFKMGQFNITIEGTADYLQHRRPTLAEDEFWATECEKQSVKVTSVFNPFTLYKDEDGYYIPSEQIRACLREAGSGQKIPGKGAATWRNVLKGVSVRLSADRIRFINKTAYDRIDERWGTIDNNQVLLRRGLFKSGWQAGFQLITNDKEIPEVALKKLLERAGETCGIGDYRPSSKKGGTFGIFKIVEFQKVNA